MAAIFDFPDFTSRAEPLEQHIRSIQLRTHQAEIIGNVSLCYDQMMAIGHRELVSEGNAQLVLFHDAY